MHIFQSGWSIMDLFYYTKSNIHIVLYTMFSLFAKLFRTKIVLPACNCWWSPFLQEGVYFYYYLYSATTLLIDFLGIPMIERRSSLVILWTPVQGWLTACWRIVFELCPPSIALFTCKAGLITLLMVCLLCWYATLLHISALALDFIRLSYSLAPDLTENIC